MATYNFDKIINRKGTNCLKYDYAVERGKPADVLPLWVADMDFTVSEEITKSLHIFDFYMHILSFHISFPTNLIFLLGLFCN